MQAKVTTAFKGRPDKENAVRRIEVGELLDGDLAMVAVDNGWAVEDDGEAEKQVLYSDMTLQKLKDYAAEREIDVSKAKKKADVIAVIEAAEKAKVENEGGDK